MEEQAYINATIDIRIPTYIPYNHFSDIDNRKEELAQQLYDNPNELLEYQNIKIKVLDVEVE